VQLDELLRRCEQELAAGVALREACIRQQQAMVAGGPDEVEAAAAATAGAARAWREAAQARQAAAQALGASDLTDLAASLPPELGARVRAHRDRLRGGVAEIQRVNRQNDLLARHRLAVIDRTLQRLVGGRAPTYGPQGRRALAARRLSKGA
jgi:hypothetical protein